jgi:hypothetical protein
VIDEEMTARLLRLGGMRPDVPAEREGRIKRAFLDEVRATSRARAARRRTATIAATLSIAAAASVAIWLGVTREAERPALGAIATVERLEGDPVLQKGSAAPARLALGDTLQVGDRITSGAASRVGLRLPNGTSVRVDRGSRARLVSVNRVALDAGALYVDSGPDAQALEITTSFGLVRDIGTQFEIRLDDSSLRVRVRSGVIEVHRGIEVSSARPGTELIVTSEVVTNRPVAPYGRQWEWAASLGPEFDIEGRSLSAFLEYLCREQGWTLVYADSRLALEASGIMLRGSAKGLQPSDALAAVLPTTGLTYRVKDGELAVARAVQP